MRIVKFEGATMRDALAKVKAELGDDAVIVSTRQIRRGLLGGQAIEISAAIDDREDDAPVRTPRFATTPPPAPRHAEEDLEKMIAPVRSELRSLRAIVRTSSEGRATEGLKAEIAALRALVETIQKPTPPPAPTLAPAATRPRITIPPKARVAPSDGRIVMLVGPTGAGKTTTIAKLAARAALIDQRTVGLVTLDNYRVGGVDQIRTFADLIGVPLQTATTAAALAEIIELDDSELVLIDTAGRSPRDAGAIAELAAQLVHLPAVEVHLVIPATSSAAMIDDLVARYAPLAPSRLLFTKLDEVGPCPELLGGPTRANLPITWVTTGQAVPEDLEEPTAARLSELATRGFIGIEAAA